MLLGALVTLAVLPSAALARPAPSGQDFMIELESRAQLEARGEYTSINSGRGFLNYFRPLSERLLVVPITYSSGTAPMSTWRQDSFGGFTPYECAFRANNDGAALMGLSNPSTAAGDTYCSYGPSLLNGVSVANTISIDAALACDRGNGGLPLPSCGGPGGMQTYRNARLVTDTLASALPFGSAWVLQTQEHSHTARPCSSSTCGVTPQLLAYKAPLAQVTIKNCLQTCEGTGFAIAGLKGGDSCWCGTQFYLIPNGYETYPEDDISCSGDPSVVCGSMTGTTLYRLSSKLDRNFVAINGYVQGRYESTVLSITSAASTASVASVSASSLAALSQVSLTSLASLASQASAASQASVLSTASVASASALSAQSTASVSSVASVSLTSVAAAEASAAARVITLSTHGFSSTGDCIAEVSGRLLSKASFSSSSLTYDTCASFCFERGYQVSGVEYGRECWCGSSISASTPSTKCTMPCSGDASKICGGSSALIIFTTTEDPTTAQGSFSAASVASRASVSAASIASVASISCASVAAAQQTATALSTTHGFTSDGRCYAEVSGRLLKGASTASLSMTHAACADFCFSRGFPAAAVEYSSECFCGAVPATPAYSTQCNMKCSGDANAICGGPNALYLFTTSDTLAALSASSVASVAATAAPSPAKPSATAVTLPNGFSTSGKCVAEVSGRLLKGPSFASSSMTYTTCSSWCLDRGYYAAGVEYGSECFCGAVGLAEGAAMSTSCTMACAGDPSAICGGSDALIVFETTPPAAPVAPVPAVIAGTSWTHTQRCLAEPAGGRLLSGARLDSASLTPAACVAFCEERGLDLSGLEYSTECWCGSSASVNLAAASTSSQCTMTCPGSSTICGGPNALTLLTRA